MFDTQVNSVVSVGDVNDEIDRLLSLHPSRVVEAARYHLSAGGARVRVQLALDAATALNLSPKAAIACAVAPELLHNASLVHDDLQDGDEMRRNAPAVWARFGKDIAISTGDLLISTAYLSLEYHPHPVPALRAMHDAVAVTITGQTEDCCANYPTPEDCTNIAANKSGPLLALPIRLALIAADVPGQDIATRAARALAVAYQTLDDIEDRDADLANKTTNICLSLESSGQAPFAAQIVARNSASSILDIARREANVLHNGVGASFLALADRLEIRLKDIANAA